MHEDVEIRKLSERDVPLGVERRSRSLERHSHNAGGSELLQYPNEVAGEEGIARTDRPDRAPDAFAFGHRDPLAAIGQ